MRIKGRQRIVFDAASTSSLIHIVVVSLGEQMAASHNNNKANSCSRRVTQTTPRVTSLILVRQLRGRQKMQTYSVGNEWQRMIETREETRLSDILISCSSVTISGDTKTVTTGPERGNRYASGCLTERNKHAIQRSRTYSLSSSKKNPSSPYAV